MPPNPSCGLIRHARPTGRVLDGVETPTAVLEVTQPGEVRLYAKMFAQLQQSAVYGAEARALVTSVMADLESGWGDASR